MFALSFLSGTLAALQLPSLPGFNWLVLLPILMLGIVRIKRARILLAFPVGFLWVVAHGYHVLDTQLAKDLEGQDLVVTGYVSNLPESNNAQTRFEFAVLSMHHRDKPIVNPPKKIRLNWYGNSSHFLRLKAGELWQLQVRLKQPHGMLNPGGFDYEQWLFEQKIRATGYVRNSTVNQRLEPASFYSVNAYREKIKELIIKSMPENDYTGLVLALSLGDRSLINDEQWRVLTATGTNHLVAISGLHIGLVATAMFFLTTKIIRRFPVIISRFPAYKVSAIFAIGAAFVYAMLAGFAIPTQRALIMIAVVMLLMLLNRKPSPRLVLSAALIVVLLIDPFSALSPGFWLSFIAVAAILYAMQARANVTGWWWKWGRIQWVVSLALIPMLLISFQSFSIISPLANLLAVPWISVFVVPLVLLSALFSFVSPVAEILLTVTHHLLDVFWLVMVYFADLPFATWQQFSPQSWTILPAIVGMVLLLAPSGFPARYLSIVFLLPMFLVRPLPPANGEFSFTLLDVGQGLSAVVSTANHVLVFDTGPKFRSGFDTGEAVVVPYLKSIAAEKIDTLVISHSDNDHIGGAMSLLKNFTVEKILASETEAISSSIVSQCKAEDKWQWDGVLFEMFNPNLQWDYGSKRKIQNNQSCVLRVSNENFSVLLPGDIEKQAERLLVTHYKTRLQSDLLVAPHHGSKTSSTKIFLKQVNPEYVLFPAGYKNRWKFPVKTVKERYSALGVEQLTTANTGAISVSSSFPFTVTRFRDQQKRFWHHM